MIRINLIATDRERGKKKAAAGFQGGQMINIGCLLILIVGGLAIGWRYWTVSNESTKLDAEIAAAQQETERLRGIIQQVEQFDQRKAQLQQRVVLIEELRKNQTGPVHLLDQVSRALPPMLWLTNMRQKDNDITIEGRSTTLTGVSEFVNNLEATGYFKKSIEIVSTQTETLAGPIGQLERFQLKAIFQQPGEAEKPAAAAAPSRTGG
jgi:type IV pilus assembly protein PilN